MRPSIGMDRVTGRALDYDSDAHFEQSANDIIFTPIGSRPMLRAYGSAVPDLIDQPHNGALQLRLYAAVATALQRWEPRRRLQRVQLTAPDGSGRARLVLDTVRRDRLGRRRISRVTLPTAIRIQPAAAA